MDAKKIVDAMCSAGFVFERYPYDQMGVTMDQVSFRHRDNPEVVGRAVTTGEDGYDYAVFAASQAALSKQSEVKQR